jgi:hypothetical protein
MILRFRVASHGKDWRRGEAKNPVNSAHLQQHATPTTLCSCSASWGWSSDARNKSKLWVLIKWKWLWSVSSWCVLLNEAKNITTWASSSKDFSQPFFVPLLYNTHSTRFCSWSRINIHYSILQENWMCCCEERRWPMLRAVIVLDSRKHHDAVPVTGQHELKCYCSNDCPLLHPTHDFTAPP